MSSSTIGTFDDWHDFLSLYSVEITIGVLLSALTIYRKQLSSNRCFHQEEDANIEEAETKVLTFPDEMEGQTEELLDSAGLYCSGAPIVSLASHWIECFPGEDVEGLSSKLWLQEEEVTTSDLLEKAGNFCSAELVAALLYCFLHKKAAPAKSIGETSDFHDPFTHNFPPDVHVHIVSFLHPKDVTTLSCVSKNYNEVITKSETSKAVWKTLWRRDYAWLVEQWQVGKDALERADVGQTWELDKTFYFLFGQTYLNWIIAGENTTDRCLVGLHNNIYDITPFLYTHPGSPDTLMVHSGKEATSFFEDMGHSNGARRIARSLCVVADLSATPDGQWGVVPTKNTIISTNVSKICDDNDPSLLLGRKQQRKQVGTLEPMRDMLQQEQVQVERSVQRKYSADSSILGGHVNTYYDPFRREWRIWYTNSNLQNVFAAA
eukprot:scaffold672_cov126-Cylindrotheca_fusiformis.AAC.22